MSKRPPHIEAVLLITVSAIALATYFVYKLL